MKRWFLTVDWCNKGNRGVFCNIHGGSFAKDTQHTKDEMDGILGPFTLILDPQSIELDEAGLKEYHRLVPLAEYSNQFGVACKVPQETTR